MKTEGHEIALAAKFAGIVWSVHFSEANGTPVAVPPIVEGVGTTEVGFDVEELDTDAPVVEDGAFVVFVFASAVLVSVFFLDK